MSVSCCCQHCCVREAFLGSEALAQGRLTEYELRRWHRTVFRDVFVRKGHELSLRDRIEGAWLRSEIGRAHV